MEITLGKYTMSCRDAYRLMSMAKRIDDKKEELSEEEEAEIGKALDGCGGNICSAEEALRKEVFDNMMSLEKIAELTRTTVENLKKSTELDLYGLHITSLIPLSELKNLRSINLDRTKISDLSPLEGLVYLESLSLDSTKITDITPLKKLTYLKSLKLNFTEVSDLTPLTDLKELETLGLDFTKVTDLSPLRKLKKLTNLYLGFTPVKDISPLKDLKKLYQIDLVGTKVPREEIEVLSKTLPNCIISK